MSLKTIRLLMGLLWCLIGIDLFAHYILQPKLPPDVLSAITHTPGYIYMQITLVLSLILLALATLKIWQAKQSGPWLLLTAGIIFSISNFLFNPQAVYQWLSLLNDSSMVLFGFIVGVVFSQPYQTTTIGPATYRNMIILSVGTFLFFILAFISAVYTDPTMPPVLLDFYHAQLTNPVLEKIGFIALLVELLSFIFLYLQLNLGRYLFLLAVIGLIARDAYAADALTGLDAVLGQISLWLLGTLLSILYCPPLAQQWTKIKG